MGCRVPRLHDLAPSAPVVQAERQDRELGPGGPAELPAPRPLPEDGGTALLVGGAIRSRFIGEHLGRAGTELIAMAAVGVGVAYGIGRLLHAAGVGS